MIRINGGVVDVFSNFSHSDKQFERGTVHGKAGESQKSCTESSLESRVTKDLSNVDR